MSVIRLTRGGPAYSFAELDLLSDEALHAHGFDPEDLRSFAQESSARDGTIDFFEGAPFASAALAEAFTLTRDGVDGNYDLPPPVPRHVVSVGVLAGLALGQRDNRTHVSDTLDLSLSFVAATIDEAAHRPPTFTIGPELRAMMSADLAAITLGARAELLLHTMTPGLWAGAALSLGLGWMTRTLATEGYFHDCSAFGAMSSCNEVGSFAERSTGLGAVATVAPHLTFNLSGGARLSIGPEVGLVVPLVVDTHGNYPGAAHERGGSTMPLVMLGLAGALAF